MEHYSLEKRSVPSPCDIYYMSVEANSAQKQHLPMSTKRLGVFLRPFLPVKELCLICEAGDIS
jgi:hypothetical protein